MPNYNLAENTQKRNQSPGKWGQQWLVNQRLIWIILFLLVVMSNINGVLIANLDDLSVLRAASYISRFPNDPLLEQLTNHLETNASRLAPKVYDRFYVRLTVTHNYIAHNWLIGILEKLPLYSPYQSVFLATLIIHLLAATALFLSFDWLFGGESAVLKIIFLLSLIPIAYFPFYDAFLSPFPFQSGDHNWFIPAPRGAAFLFYFAFLLLWAKAGDPSISLKKRYGFAFLLLAATFIAHQSTAVLLFVPTLLIAGFYALLRQTYLQLAGNLGLKNFLLLFNLLWIIVAVIKLLVLTFYQANNTLSLALLMAFILIFWAVASNLLIYYWLKGRLRTDDEKTRLQKTGNTLMGYFIPLAIFGIGFNLFQPVVFFGDWFLPFEAGFRIIGLIHLLWWMILGIFVYDKVKHKHWPHLNRAIIAILISLCVGMTLVLLINNSRYNNDLFDQALLSVQSSQVLTRAGSNVYANEVVYFQAIANELRLKNVE